MTGTGVYIRIFIATAALIIGGAAVINMVVDPYDISRLVDIRGFNDNKAREEGFARLRKPFDLWRRHYDGIVLGSSQVERGMATDNPALTTRSLTLYNAGISEERPFEQALLLKHAIDVSGIKFAIISLDFLRYVGGGGRPDFLPHDWTRWRGVGDYLKTLVSYTTLVDSAATVAVSWSHRPSLQHQRDGLMNVEELERIGVPHVRQLFDAVDEVYLNSAYAPALQYRAALERDGFDHAALRDMLATAHRTGVRLYFFITPSHARQFEIMYMLGLARLYREWEGQLTCELAHDGREAGQPFPLWDFSGYNSVTTDPVPARDSAAVMRWYFDPVHYKPVVGRSIEDLLLGLPANELPGVEDFGARLTLDTLDAHLAAVVRGRQQYLAAHPDFLPALTALYHGPPLATPAADAEDISPHPCPVARR